MFVLPALPPGHSCVWVNPARVTAEELFCPTFSHTFSFPFPQNICRTFPDHYYLSVDQPGAGAVRIQAPCASRSTRPQDSWASQLILRPVVFFSSPFRAQRPVTAVCQRGPIKILTVCFSTHKVYLYRAFSSLLPLYFSYPVPHIALTEGGRNHLPNSTIKTLY
jgi:hypothetical protein